MQHSKILVYNFFFVIACSFFLSEAKQIFIIAFYDPKLHNILVNLGSIQKPGFLGRKNKAN